MFLPFRLNVVFYRLTISVILKHTLSLCLIVMSLKSLDGYWVHSNHHPSTDSDIYAKTGWLHKQTDQSLQEKGRSCRVQNLWIDVCHGWGLWSMFVMCWLWMISINDFCLVKFFISKLFYRMILPQLGEPAFSNHFLCILMKTMRSSWGNI